MNIFGHIMTAVAVGLVLAGAWLAIYGLVVVLIWLAEHVAFYWVMALLMFIGGTAFYLLENPYV